jgi:hypothetical protein
VLAKLTIPFLQDLKRLIIIGLRLSDDLKHLDGLNNLTALLLGKCVFQHSFFVKARTMPIQEHCPAKVWERL